MRNEAQKQNRRPSGIFPAKLNPNYFTYPAAYDSASKSNSKATQAPPSMVSARLRRGKNGLLCFFIFQLLYFSSGVVAPSVNAFKHGYKKLWVLFVKGSKAGQAY